MARWAEGNGFESLWFGEHSHIPTSRKSPFPMGGELPVYYKEFFDPFIGLTAAAAVTTKLKVGTSVCLVPEHNRINLAKAGGTVSSDSTGSAKRALQVNRKPHLRGFFTLPNLPVL
jgi:alkanesulfonate monooxygenase SsuD/methylene tetrahydromethanopterin reductase-like flavin-dependent oxidoreductase (luciferase family)